LKSELVALHQLSQLGQPLLLVLQLLARDFLSEERDLGGLVLEDRLLVVGELVHQSLRQLLYFLLSVSVSSLAIIGSNDLGTCRLGVVEGVAERSLSLLILDLDQSLVLLDQKLANLKLAVPCCEVEGRVSELVLVVNLAVLLLAKHGHDVDAAGLGTRK